MKKAGLIVATLMLAGTVAMAVDPVYSVNSVGYQRLSVAQGLNMYAINWNLIGGVDKVPIDGMFDSSTLLAGDDLASSDNIYVWDTSMNGGQGGYKQYYLWNGDRKWYEFMNDANPTTNALDRGQGFWLRHRAAATNTLVAGEVPTEGTNVVMFAPGLNQFGSAYTANMVFNSATIAWAGNAGDDFASSDNINIWDPSLNGGQGGYKQYYLWNGDSKWYEFLNDANPTTDSLPMGRGAWYRNRGGSSVSMSEARPY